MMMLFHPSSCYYVVSSRASVSSSLSRRQLAAAFVVVNKKSRGGTSSPHDDRTKGVGRASSFHLYSTSSVMSDASTNSERRYITTTTTVNNHHLNQTSALDHKKSFENTPLGRQGKDLLDGLDVYSVPARGDGHPLAVYGIDSQNPTQYQDVPTLRPILLLHGRTWSSVPVYHLMGGPRHRAKGDESRSFMEALLEKGLVPYAMDFRGFGGTPADDTGHVEPMRCVRDTESVLAWIAERHGLSAARNSAVGGGATTNVDRPEPPALLGWSQGALVAQLVAQHNSSLLSKLVLYGSIYDPLYRYAREPLYQQQMMNRNANATTTTTAATRPEPRLNTFDDAIEDFTIQGTIPPEPACHFANAALISDPIKASWKYLYQFNNCDPARVHVPTLIVAGDQDPYAPLHVQQTLFCNLGRGSDRTWSILSDCDHAVHMLEGRARLTNIVVSFVLNGKRSEHPPSF